MYTTCKISDFVDPVRQVTKDTSSSPYRDNDTICGAVVDAFRELHSVRPSSRYSPDGLLTDEKFEADKIGENQVSYDDRWHMGIVYYAAARCFGMDITDSVNLQLSQMLFKSAAEEFSK